MPFVVLICYANKPLVKDITMILLVTFPVNTLPPLHVFSTYKLALAYFLLNSSNNLNLRQYMHLGCR